MRVKPWPILIIAFIFITAPLANILWSAKLNNTTIYDYLEYIYYSHSIIENMVWILLPIITGFSILRFRSWSYYLLIFFIIFIGIYYFLDYRESPEMSFWAFIGFQSINIFIGIYFLLPSVRNVYTKPQLRWWEQKPRYILEHPLVLEASNQLTPATIKNISVGGMLIVTDLQLSQGDHFKIVFEMFQKKFLIEAQVAHIGKDGYGVFFTHIEPNQFEFNKIIDQMALQGYPLRTPPPSSLESFKTWLYDFIRGKGFTPKAETPPKKK